MLERTDQRALLKTGRREAFDYAIGLAFFGVLSIAMTAWIAAMIWVGWRLIVWIFF